MPVDSSDVDNALVMKLGSDAALLALCPNGVYVDEAPPGSTKFVIVSLVDESDVREFNRRSFEDALYMVKAVMSKSSGGDVKAAAARIDALLENGSLTVNGYTHMVMHREGRIRATEVDDIEPSIRWFHRGGNYRVQVSVN